MSTITFTIPDDPTVFRALAAYLLAKAGPEPNYASGTIEISPLQECNTQECDGGVSTGTEQVHSFITGGDEVVGFGTGLVENASQTAIHEEAPTAAHAPTGVELAKDSTGAMVPWDVRIHARTKAILQDGSWRKKRGVEEPLVAQVEAELRAAMAAPAPTNESPAPAPAPSVQTESASEATPPNPAAAAFGSAPAPSPAPAPVGSITTLPDLITKITQNAIPMDRVLEVLQPKGIAALPLLGPRPDLIPTVATELGLQ